MICPQTYLTMALERADPALVSKGTQEAMSRFAATLPDAASGHIIECRLADPGGACDYSMVLSRGDGGFEVFQQCIDGDPFWAQAEALLTATQSTLGDAGLVWLEFDFADDRPAAPCFFVSHGPQSDADQRGFALGAALAEVFVLPIGETLRQLALQVPVSVRLKQAGIMAGRGARSLRLVLDGVKSDTITTFLQTLDWPGDMGLAADLQRIAHQIAPQGRCRIDLDLGEGLAPTLGIELLYSDLAKPDLVAGALLREGLSVPETAAALVNMMPRRTLFTSAEQGMPHRLDFGLNHLKLSAQPATQGLEAKAYFSLLNLPDFQQISV